MRLELDGLVHIGQGLLVVAARARGDGGTHHIGTGIVFRQFQRAVHMLERLHGVFAHQVQMRQAQLCPVIVRVDRQQAVVGTLRRLVVVQLAVAHRRVHHEHLLLGHKPQALGVVGHRAGKVATVLACHTAHLIGVHDEGVALDGQRGVLLGTIVILEVDFSHGTVEIRLGKKRLGFNHLIKILNRQDVILKVKCIATDGHHLVGIDLRPCGAPGQGHHRHDAHQSVSCLRLHHLLYESETKITIKT